MIDANTRAFMCARNLMFMTRCARDRIIWNYATKLFHLAMHLTITFLTQHTDLSMDIDSLFDTIRLCSEELFTIGLKLSKFV